MKALKTLLLSFLLSGIFFSLQAQSTAESLFTDISSINDSILLENCPVFVDSSNNTDPPATLHQNWKPLSAYNLKNSIPKSWVTKTIFLQVNLANSGTGNDTVYIHPGLMFSSIKIFQVIPGGQLEQLKDESRDDGYQPVSVKNGSKQSFIMALRPAKTIYNSLRPIIVQKNFIIEYQKIHYYKYAKQQTVGYVISGILLMMFIFSLVNYFLSVKKEFLLNACYTGCMFLLIFFTTYFERQSGVSASFFASYTAFILLAVGTIFYIDFTRKFLDTPRNYQMLNKIFVWEEWGVFIIIICFSVLHFFTNNFMAEKLLENIMKITALLIGIVYIIFSLTQKNRLLNYLAIGNLVLIIGSIISFYILLHPMGRKSVFSTAIFYYELGIAGELMFFLLGLTYKNRIELITKIQEQEASKLDVEKQSFETKLAVINAKQKERNRISADMHDELGAGITAIRLYSELAKSKTEKGVIPEIEKISDSANELLVNMNAIIWAMSSSNDSLENMVAYIRSYSQEYFENTGIKCKINLMENLPDIAVWGEFRKNVFLVIKESLNNILKHSKATEVTITFTQVADGLALYIQDNGVGIDLDKVRRFGNGLKNMKRRMNDMNIDFTIENKNGTLITLHYAMPL
jgi:signal transduction histidine kinase